MINRNVLDRRIARLEHLLADLKRLHSGWQPSAIDMPEVPFVEGWWRSAIRIPVPRALQVSGHPRLGDGHDLVTTPLVVALEECGLRRTESRWYRLGDARVPTNEDLARAPYLENWTLYWFGAEQIFTGTVIRADKTEGARRHGPIARMDEAAGWLMDESGEVYRLGTPARPAPDIEFRSPTLR